MNSRSWRRWTLALWAAAIALAFVGPIYYLVHPTDKAWWLSGLAGVPLLLLILQRADRKGFEGHSDSSIGDGPLTPP
jgi:apolipoprotein N-acyltransferase